jgi:hypothetical protein
MTPRPATGIAVTNSVTPVRRPAGNEMNVMFQSRPWPLVQRVSEWVAASVTKGDILVTLHFFPTCGSPIMC